MERSLGSACGICSFLNTTSGKVHLLDSPRSDIRMHLKNFCRAAQNETPHEAAVFIGEVLEKRPRMRLDTCVLFCCVSEGTCRTDVPFCPSRQTTMNTRLPRRPTSRTAPRAKREGIVHLDPIEQAAIDTATHVFEAVAEVLVSSGISNHEAAHLLKSAYVRTAWRLLGSPKRPATVSAVFVATGIEKSDVQRITHQPRAQLWPGPSLSKQVALRWCKDLHYADAEGQPSPLKFRTTAGSPSFCHLVAKVSRDVPCAALLDEMLRLGWVAVAGQQVSLLRACPNDVETDANSA